MLGVPGRLVWKKRHRAIHLLENVLPCCKYLVGGDSVADFTHNLVVGDDSYNQFLGCRYSVGEGLRLAVDVDANKLRPGVY